MKEEAHTHTHTSQINSSAYSLASTAFAELLMLPNSGARYLELLSTEIVASTSENFR